MIANRLALAALVLGALLSAGCGSSPPTGVVQGKVMLEGQPLKFGGSVVFYPEKGNPKGTVIGPDGDYRVEGVELGLARIEVKVHGAVPPGLQNPPQPLPRTAKIPPRYANHRESGLEFSVKKGEQTYDIPLKPL